MITATHLHAMVVHFPIALLLVGFLSEIMALLFKNSFFKNVAFYLLLLGALGATAAFLSGHFAGEGIEEGPLKNPMELHENAALFTLLLSIGLAFFRVVIFYFKYDKVWTTWVSILAFTLLTGSVSLTGYLGGQLVNKYGAGVELTLPNASDNDEE